MSDDIKMPPLLPDQAKYLDRVMYAEPRGDTAMKLQSTRWGDKNHSSEQWQSGCEFALLQLCHVLNVDPKTVTWDVATETLDGDVRAVIDNIVREKYGEDWDPDGDAPRSVRTAVLSAKAEAAFFLGEEIRRRKQAVLCLEKFVNYESWMDRLPDGEQVSTFKRHTFGDLREALKIIFHESDCRHSGQEA